jgi:hypothetical protein
MHANALNAEHDNTGAGIFLSAVSRALRGEPDPAVALQFSYRKVDLWPLAVSLRDLPIYFGNENPRMDAGLAANAWTVERSRQEPGRMKQIHGDTVISRKQAWMLLSPG